MRYLPTLLLASLPAMLAPLLATGGEAPAAPAAKTGAEAPAPPGHSPDLEAALERLKLPGVKINPKEWCVDVEGSICLREGLLELIACTKGTKEHESIVVVEAKPSHIHTALLLLRASPGNPAMHKALDAEGTRFLPVPPRGGAVDVSLLCKDREGKLTESPINEFIARAGQDEQPGADGAPEGADARNKFPTHTFLFAGSILHGQGEGPRQYLCDQSGNLISIATFGDELLCLPGIHENDNGALVWEANSDRLPPRGTKVTLRLRPKVERKAPPPLRSGEAPASSGPGSAPPAKPK
jgi:hypothetical protein